MANLSFPSAPMMALSTSQLLNIINDLVFENTRKFFQSKQKQLKKRGKGNKLDASVALTNEELNDLCDKGLLGMYSPGALLNTPWSRAKQHSSLWTPWVQRTSWYVLRR